MSVEQLESRRLLSTVADAGLLLNEPDPHLIFQYESNTYGNVAFDPEGVTVRNLTHDQVYRPPYIDVTHRAGPDQVRVDFPFPLPADPPVARPGLPRDGNYDAILSREALTNVTGAHDAVWRGHFLHGDLDGDRSVGISDFAIYRANSGKADVGYGQGDLNGDGEVTIDDFAQLRGQFGKAIPKPPPGGSFVDVIAAGYDSTFVVRGEDAPDAVFPERWGVFRSDDGLTYEFHDWIYDEDDGLPDGRATDTTYPDSGLMPGRRYWYRMRPWTAAAGFGHTTREGSAVTILPPPDDSPFAASTQGNEFEIDVDWDPAALPDHVEDVVIWASFGDGDPIRYARLDAADGAYTFGSTYREGPNDPTGEVSLMASFATSDAESIPVDVAEDKRRHQAGGEQGFQWGGLYGGWPDPDGPQPDNRGVTLSPDVGASAEPITIESGSSRTFTIGNLPEHREIALGISLAMRGHDEVDNNDPHEGTVTISLGDQPAYERPWADYRADPVGHPTDIGPFVHSGGSISITVALDTPGSGDSIGVKDISATTWTPVVRPLSYDNTLNEDGDAGTVSMTRGGDNGLTEVKATVSPAGTTGQDDAAPDHEDDNNASAGGDYFIPHSELTVPIGEVYATESLPVRPNDDDEAEGVEVIRLGLLDGDGYVPDHGTQAVLLIDDNVSVKYIRVMETDDPNLSSKPKSIDFNGYDIPQKIVIYGESVERMVLNQEALTTINVTGYDNSTKDINEVYDENTLSADEYPATSAYQRTVLQSNGWVQDREFSYITPILVPGTNGGEGYVSDLWSVHLVSKDAPHVGPPNLPDDAKITNLFHHRLNMRLTVYERVLGVIGPGSAGRKLGQDVRVILYNNFDTMWDSSDTPPPPSEIKVAASSWQGSGHVYKVGISG